MVNADINAPLEKSVWNFWTLPEHIIKNGTMRLTTGTHTHRMQKKFTDRWENFSPRMEAKDGSMGF